MALRHRCSHGELVESSGLWRTQNILEFDFPSAPFGCCVNHYSEVTNCYFFNTTVNARHSDRSPQSPMGDMGACSYLDGTCTLSDGSILVWTPDGGREWSYTMVARMSGHMMGAIWMSNDKEFALSWNDRSPRATDCLKQLIITDQGYAVWISQRKRRQVSDSVGLVTSKQLAAQLLAVEGATLSSVSVLFRNALRTLCDRTNIMTVSLHAALATSPTPTMRALLNRQDISATHLGGGYVEVRRCVALPPSSVRLLPFNTTCYNYPRAELSLPSGMTMQTFLDPVTGVLLKQASTVDCKNVSPFVFVSPTGLRNFAPTKGTWSTTPSRDIIPIPSLSHLAAVPLAPPLTIFHNLILTNFSEVTNEHQLREWWIARDHRRLLDHFTHTDTSGLGQAGQATSSTVPAASLFSVFPFSFSFFDLWVTSCCGLVTLSLVKKLYYFISDSIHPFGYMGGNFRRHPASHPDWPHRNPRVYTE
ncbi:unnamed protein product [Haemonchus placei]|uniref:Bee-milk protein n=1 Tax=Haemonchus placei TaxID=6290 RepID=A0A0N4WJI5_HAEPC|nr:unnamed protein product [Haemonchus placei]